MQFMIAINVNNKNKKNSNKYKKNAFNIWKGKIKDGKWCNKTKKLNNKN